MDLTPHRLLRIYLGESDRADGRPLYEVLVERARACHLSGATVLRGPVGFGRSSRLHTAKILRLSEDLPLVIEIVDEEASVLGFLEQSAELLGGVLVTLEKVDVVEFGGVLGGTGTPQ